MAKAVKAVKSVVQPVAETVAEEVAVIEVQPMQVPEVQVPEIVQQAEDVNYQVSEMLTEVGKIDKSVKELEDKIVELRKVKMGWNERLRVHAHAAEDERKFVGFTEEEIAEAVDDYKNAFTTAAGFMGQFIIPAIGFDNFKFAAPEQEHKYSNEVVEKLTNLGFINKVGYKSALPIYNALDNYIASKTANDANILKMVRDVGYALGYRGDGATKTDKSGEVRETLAENKFWSVDGKNSVVFRVKKLKDGVSCSAGGASLLHYIKACGLTGADAEAERDRVKALADAWFAEWKQENGIK